MKKHIHGPSPVSRIVIVAIILLPSAMPAGETKQSIEHSEINGASLTREGNVLSIRLMPDVASGEVRIPRYCGRIRSIRANGDSSMSNIGLSPGITHWSFSWPDSQTNPDSIIITFDRMPLLLSELQPIGAEGDGSFLLNACDAATVGEKLRYEPQTFKNTVGYWVNPEDYASWRLQIETPGEFNVSILQGCGVGHGGSTAAIGLSTGSTNVANLEFTVHETGHFQNFHWRTVGKLTVTKPGLHKLRVSAVNISKGALMDVRAIHLVRLPETVK